jgi:hypothetical protein
MPGAEIVPGPPYQDSRCASPEKERFIASLRMTALEVAWTRCCEWAPWKAYAYVVEWK